MLDERKASILRAVVEEYIQTAQPVGSGHVAQAPGVGVSPATVRNEMAVLEDEGYLHQPHTSAGRVPTDKGYRFFVDSLSEPGRLGAAEAQQVRTFFQKAHGEIEQMLADTSRLLSNITDYAAVVVAPPHEVATVRSVQLVGLSARLALLVVVYSNGAIDKRTIELDDDADELRLNAATAHLAAHLVGETLRSVPELPTTGDDGTDALVTAARTELAGEGDADEVFVGGTSRMLASFDAVDTVRRVLGILEQQLVVVTVLRDVLDRGLSVAIGSETGVEPLAECSLVVSPYVVDGEGVGTVGVLGPTRMNYPQALAAVAVVSQRLGTRLSEG